MYRLGKAAPNQLIGAAAGDPKRCGEFRDRQKIGSTYVKRVAQMRVRYEFVRQRKVPSVRLARLVRIPPKAFHRWMEEQTSSDRRKFEP